MIAAAAVPTVLNVTAILTLTCLWFVVGYDAVKDAAGPVLRGYSTDLLQYWSEISPVNAYIPRVHVFCDTSQRTSRS